MDRLAPLEKVFKMNAFLSPLQQTRFGSVHIVKNTTNSGLNDTLPFISRVTEDVFMPDRLGLKGELLPGRGKKDYSVIFEVKDHHPEATFVYNSITDLQQRFRRIMIQLKNNHPKQAQRIRKPGK
jgi:hypothetical protein